MKNNSFKEIIVSVALIILVILLLNPSHFYMPTMMLMSILVFALVAFGLFSSFILRESATDEREIVHRTLAGRIAFFVGSAVTILAILVQSLSEHVDPWLVVILVSMIIAKVLTRLYSDKNY